jgi:hypothetical protein
MGTRSWDNSLMDWNEPDWKQIPMERIDHKRGDRFVLVVFTKDRDKPMPIKRYGGHPVSPLYGPQARRLRNQQRKAGFLTQLFRLSPDGRRVIESDF